MKRTPPQLATWLLKHLYCGPEHEAVLGDLLERYERGKAFAWYWKQVVATILASSVSNFGRYARIGFAIGGVNGGFSILENVAWGHPRGVMHFNALSSVLIPAFVVFFMRKSLRGVYVAACIAGLTFSTMLVGFSVWRFRHSSSEWLWTIPKFALFDFSIMFFLVVASGAVAVRLPNRVRRVLIRVIRG